MNDPIRITVEEPWLVPARQYPGDAGADLKAKEIAFIEPGECEVVGTGVAIAIPYGYAGLVFPRSGLATKEGLRLANCVGVIDYQYRDEIKVPLYNDSGQTRAVSRGERVAQLVILPIELPEFPVVDSLPPTDRGKGGFGSTGV